ncbi:hypothetical protein NA57DRAFT_52975 [Rhizodiscina lignyota]|uniref:TECPR1-like DysF domain-containing protein n=1 Tax=Rhizodiscina lignyota TaxID=1504668 RepID=A0A9P4IP25_9PEZI|nr:hypothetical protein NA57DRAFT_52975 [Rhizodiscina lignyota]
MDEGTDDAFVNRNSPIPILIVNPEDDTLTPTDSEPSERRRDAFKNSMSPSRLKENISPSRLKEKLEQVSEKKSASSSLQDRMFTINIYLMTCSLSRLLQRIIPSDDSPTDAPSSDRRSRPAVERPNFSIPLMSNNFRRFNARIGVAFVFQNRLIRLFTWRRPTHTLSFLACYTFICLDPYLLAVAPLAATIFFIMVPAFLARHPPPPTSNVDPVMEKEIELYAYPLQGPPLAPAKKIRPAPDLSKDFFRNMRDLQNCMEDFSRLHDAVVSSIAPLTNFSNEAVSSALFLALTALACPLFVFSHLLPWRTLFLVGGWVAISLGHPSVIKSLQQSGAEKTVKEERKEAENFAQKFIADDIVLSSAPEKREVEIFELQQRVRATSSLFSSLGFGVDAEDEPEYELVMYSANPFTPLDPGRVSGARPKGTRFFEDVQPPRGWTWSESKWRLDLGSQDWVGERCNRTEEQKATKSG